ncbi:glycosyltransferase family 4 protein [uncultured Catenibacterium sp.]|uniref:glycosyltransferase family 4 protein n=1 Tax=uncultured Catenibacterium sp. TaxID=286142 RepID=UPI002598D504|nr:glycosyltransferase family 4 protein [uncultured Catenibacterium sp.]
MENIKYNALFVISSSFPYGEAFSSRARNMIKLFNECGYKVFVVAPDSQKSVDCIELESFEYETHYVHDPKNFLSLSGIGTAKPYITAIEKLSKHVKFNLIVSSAMVHVTDYLYKWSRENHVPYIMEQCEWYDESTFKGGKFNPYYREHIRLIEKKNKRVDGIIAISKLFEEHYTDMGVKTVRVPTILDIKNTSFREHVNEREKIHIIFAGSLGKGKEKLANIFNALKQVNKDTIKIVLDIYGANENQVLENIKNDFKSLSEIKEFVYIHGRIPQFEIPNKVKEADFTIFIRPNRKSSNAGFPTKFAESLAVGTPVITNLTGDIGLYLRDGENGLVVSDDSEDQLKKTFNKIIEMKAEDLSKMRKIARKTAEQYFDFREYTNIIEDLFSCSKEKYE